MLIARHDDLSGALTDRDGHRVMEVRTPPFFGVIDGDDPERGWLDWPEDE
jgi:hypothetical protein